MTRPAATAWPASASSYLHSFCTMLQSLTAIWLHRTDLFEQSVMHSERLGSMLNSRALHSATPWCPHWPRRVKIDCRPQMLRNAPHSAPCVGRSRS